MTMSAPTCGDCGLPHSIDSSLPSDVWNRIAEPHEMLCPVCIDARLVKHGLTCDAKFYFNGRALHGYPYGVRTR